MARMERLFFIDRKKVNLWQLYTQLYYRQIHFLSLYAQLMAMNKLWKCEIRSIFHSHVDPIFFKTFSDVFNSIGATYVPIIFQQFNILVFFIRASTLCIAIYMMIQYLSLYIFLSQWAFERVHTPKTIFLRCFIRGIIKIFTGNFHIFNHLNLIRAHVRMIHSRIFFCVPSWTNYVIW